MSNLTAQLLKPVNFFCTWLQGLAIFQWLFSFIIRSFEVQALKPVTLGPPVHRGLAQEPNPGATSCADGSMGDQTMHPLTNEASSGAAGSMADGAVFPENTTSTISKPLRNGIEKEKELPSALLGQEKSDPCETIQQMESQGGRPEEGVPATSTAADQDKAPKKSVSFSETTEVISKKRKKKKATDRMNSSSTDHENDEKSKESRPLRPILKVGSNVNEKFDMFTVQRQATMG